MKNTNTNTNDKIFTTTQIVQFLFAAFFFIYFGGHLLIHLNA